MKKLFKWTFRIVVGTFLVVATIILMRAFDARRQPPLKPWHGTLSAEFRAKDATDKSTLADYLKIEEAVFAQMEREVIAKVARLGPRPLQPLLARRRRQPDALSAATGTTRSSWFRTARSAAACC